MRCIRSGTTKCNPLHRRAWVYEDRHRAVTILPQPGTEHNVSIDFLALPEEKERERGAERRECAGGQRAMATRDLTRRFAELRVLRHGADGAGLETKRPGDAFSESGLLDVSHACGQPSTRVVSRPEA